MDGSGFAAILQIYAALLGDKADMRRVEAFLTPDPPPVLMPSPPPGPQSPPPLSPPLPPASTRRLEEQHITSGEPSVFYFRHGFSNHRSHRSLATSDIDTSGCPTGKQIFLKVHMRTADEGVLDVLKTINTESSALSTALQNMNATNEAGQILTPCGVPVVSEPIRKIVIAPSPPPPMPPSPPPPIVNVSAGEMALPIISMGMAISTLESEVNISSIETSLLGLFADAMTPVSHSGFEPASSALPGPLNRIEC